MENSRPIPKKYICGKTYNDIDKRLFKSGDNYTLITITYKPAKWTEKEITTKEAKSFILRAK